MFVARLVFIVNNIVNLLTPTLRVKYMEGYKVIKIVVSYLK